MHFAHAACGHRAFAHAHSAAPAQWCLYAHQSFAFWSLQTCTSRCTLHMLHVSIARSHAFTAQRWGSDAYIFRLLHSEPQHQGFKSHFAHAACGHCLFACGLAAFQRAVLIYKVRHLVTDDGAEHLAEPSRPVLHR